MAFFSGAVLTGAVLGALRAVYVWKIIIIRQGDHKEDTWPWLLRRPILGQYERLMKELNDEDVPAFKNFVKVEPAMFRETLARLGPRINRTSTSTIAEGPRDALSQLKSCQLLHNCTKNHI